jgi:hypothetical protein
VVSLFQREAPCPAEDCPKLRKYHAPMVTLSKLKIIIICHKAAPS